MIDLSLSALTKAWVTTMIASGLLLGALAVAQLCTNEVYLQNLRRAVQLTGEYPSPDIDGLAGEPGGGAVQAYAARAGHSGSW